MSDALAQLRDRVEAPSLDAGRLDPWAVSDPRPFGCVCPFPAGDKFGFVEERLEGAALMLRAIDLTIADIELREDGGDRQEQLQILRDMRERWLEKAEEERGG